METVYRELSEEEAALLANHIRVLVAEVNEKLEEASERGLEVEVEAVKGFKVRPRARVVQSLEVRIRREVS